MRLAFSFALSHTLLSFYQVSWSIFWIGWWLLGKRQQASVVKVPRWQRMFNLLAVVIGFALLLDPQFHVGAFGAYWLPHQPFVATIGVILFLFGLCFMCWARVHLGTNWSGNAALDADHRLIKSGPYALVRHPIYTGLLVAMAGTAVTNGRTGQLVGLLITAAAYCWKAWQEEKIMLDRFGPEYELYRAKTKMLLPGIF